MINKEKIKKDIDEIITRMNPDIDSGEKNIRFSKKNLYYHSIEEIGISGYRDCRERIEKWGISDLLKDKVVLDIGSNMGMMSIECSKISKKVVGLETSIGYIEISNILKNFYNIDNVSFKNISFLDYVYSEKKIEYDIILSLAVHNWLGIDIKEFMSVCDNLLHKKGIVIFETHPVDIKRYNKIKKELEFSNYNVRLIYKKNKRYVFKCEKR